MSDELEERISRGIGSLAGAAVTPAGGSAGAQTGAARRQRRGAVAGGLAGLVMLFGLAFGLTQLGDGTPAETEVATEFADGEGVDGELDPNGEADGNDQEVEVPTPVNDDGDDIGESEDGEGQAGPDDQSDSDDPDLPSTELPPCEEEGQVSGVDCQFEFVPGNFPTPTPEPTTSNDGPDVTPTATPSSTTTPTSTPTAGPTPTPTPAVGVVKLMGTVTLADGTILSGAQVSTEGAVDTTNSAGEYELTVAPGSYDLAISTSVFFGSGAAQSETVLGIESLEFSVAGNTTKNIVIDAPTAVTITVLDGDGSPRSGASVSIAGDMVQSLVSGVSVIPGSSPDAGWQAVGQTNSNGQIRLHPMAGSNQVQVTANNGPAQTFAWDGTSSSLTIQLSAGVEVSGTLTSASGSGLAGLVSLQHNFDGGGNSETSGAGAFSIETAVGTHKANVQVSGQAGYPDFIFESESFDVTADLVLSLTVDNPTPVTITLVDAGGTPLANHDIVIDGSVLASHVSGIAVADAATVADNGWNTNAITNGAGQVTLYPFGGANEISVAPPDGSARQVFSWDGSSSTVTVTLATQPRLSGRILTGTGLPFSWANISLTGIAWTSTDGSGSYSVSVASGVHPVQINTSEGPGMPGILFKAMPISITTDITLDVSFIAPVALEVFVVDNLGQPISEAEITITGAMLDSQVTGITVDPTGFENGWNTAGSTDPGGRALLYPFPGANSVVVDVLGVQNQIIAWDGASTTLTVTMP